jgi:hypothetical protein
MPIVVMRQLANHIWPKQEAKKYTCDINLQPFVILKKKDYYATNKLMYCN